MHAYPLELNWKHPGANANILVIRNESIPLWTFDKAVIGGKDPLNLIKKYTGLCFIDLMHNRGLNCLNTINSNAC